jgi:hypothetical protein
MAIATRGVVPVSSVRRPRREHWRALLEAQRRSGLSLAAFCRRRGVRSGTLSFWKWKLTHEAAADAGRGAPARRRSGPPAFVPIQLAAQPGAASLGTLVAPRAEPGELEIALANGRLVRVRGRVDLPELAGVLRTVEALGC